MCVGIVGVVLFEVDEGFDVFWIWILLTGCVGDVIWILLVGWVGVFVVIVVYVILVG